MNKEYIEREAVVEMIEENSTTRFDWSEAVDIEDLIPAIKDIPAADVAPVVHGEWENIWTLPGLDIQAACSICKDYRSRKFKNDEKKGYVIVDSYCPNCGARMDGGKK